MLEPVVNSTMLAENRHFSAQRIMIELLDKIWQQLYLAGCATLIATLVGIPLGIWITPRKHIRNIGLSLANIIQTILSIAVLALLLPFLGIGLKPALTAITHNPPGYKIFI